MDERQERLIAEAKRYVGTKEIIGANGLGTNRGVRIDYWNFEAGGDPKAGDPWCASFFSQMGIQAVGRQSWAFKVSESVQAIVDAATKMDQFTKELEVAARRVVAGIVWYYEDLHRYAHIGIPAKIDVPQRLIDTIEGNTNDGQSRDGFKVAEHVGRPVTARVGFLLWPV